MLAPQVWYQFACNALRCIFCNTGHIEKHAAGRIGHVFTSVIDLDVPPTTHLSLFYEINYYEMWALTYSESIVRPRSLIEVAEAMIAKGQNPALLHCK